MKTFTEKFSTSDLRISQLPTIGTAHPTRHGAVVVNAKGLRVDGNNWQVEIRYELPDDDADTPVIVEDKPCG